MDLNSESFPATSAQWLRRAAALDVCCVSDALDQAGEPGAVLGIHSLSVPRRVAGPAVTVRLAPVDQLESAAGRHLGTAAVEAASPGDVIVVDAHGETSAASWGGILSLAAAHRSVSGVVVDGALRDVDEAVAYDLPVYARAAVQRTARGRLHEIDWNCPIDLAGVRVAPGDLVMGDRSGVVVVAARLLAKIIPAGERIKEREDAMAADVRAGRPVTEVMGASYESMLQVRPIS
jgi:4-hydroxy-4-methyl-2-oxoglutarate aldolase